MDFIAWLRHEMELRRWDQSELARRMGAHPGTVANVVNRNRQAGPDFCIAVARALGVPREAVFRVRGWLPPTPEDKLLPMLPTDADPRLSVLAEQVRQLPADQQDAVLATWASVLSLVARLSPERSEAARNTKD